MFISGSKGSIKIDNIKIPNEVLGQAGISARFNKVVVIKATNTSKETSVYYLKFYFAEK